MNCINLLLSGQSISMEVDLDVTEVIVERTEADSVHSLTRLSSQGDFVVVDDQAPQVVNAAARTGVFYGFYYAAKSLLSSQASPSDQRYDTTGWDEADERDEDYRAASDAAEAVGRRSKFAEELDVGGAVCAKLIIKVDVIVVYSTLLQMLVVSACTIHCTHTLHTWNGKWERCITLKLCIIMIVVGGYIGLH